MQVVFEGIKGSTISGDIAIDDIQITDGACPAPGYCGFETDYCTWTNEQMNDDFDFTRFHGSTSSSSTGPSQDHTLGTRQGNSPYLLNTLHAGKNFNSCQFLAKECAPYWLTA